MNTPLRVCVPNDILRAHVEDVADVAVWDFTVPAPWKRIDMVVLPTPFEIADLAALTDLDVGLLQTQSIGYEGVLEAIPTSMRFANAAGVHERSAADMGLLLLLAMQRSLPEYVRQQDARVWDKSRTRGLEGLRVLILGAGGLGNELYDRLLVCGTDPKRMARGARVDERGEVLAISDVRDHLPSTDAVIVCLPQDASTYQLVDREFLAQMPDDALLVNIGRGGIVDTSALVDEVETGRLRAALDVTDPEPLPADHPLWALPGAMITPHAGGHVTTMPDAMGLLLREQIEALRGGLEPSNLIRRRET